MQMKKLFINIFLFSLLCPIAAHAYAGPGVALGMVIVLITVIIAFVCSSAISTFKFIKTTFKNFKKFINKKNKKKSNK